MHQHAVLSAELDDVPDDQKVPGQTKLRNQSEFPLHLSFGFHSQLRACLTAVPVSNTFHRALLKEGVRGFVLRDWVEREMVAHVPLSPLTGGELYRFSDRGYLDKKRSSVLHFLVAASEYQAHLGIRSR